MSSSRVSSSKFQYVSSFGLSSSSCRSWWEKLTEWPWTLQRPIYALYLLVSPSPKIAVFELHVILGQACWSTLNTTSSNILHIGVTCVVQSQISNRFPLRPGLFEIEVAEIRKTTNMTWEWPSKVHDYLVYTKYLPLALGAFFSLQINLYTLIMTDRTHFVRFDLQASFDFQGCWKSEMHQMTSEGPWTFSGKVPLHLYVHKIPTHVAQILFRFALRPVLSRYYRFYNSNVATMLNGENRTTGGP